MKRKLFVTLVAVLALVMVGSVFATALSVALSDNGTQGWLFGNKHNFDALADETPTFNTTDPTWVYDFTTSDIHLDFGHKNEIEWSLGDGYTSFKALGGDPHVYFNTAPKCNAVDAQYIAVSYRTSAADGVRAEFFSTRNSTGGLGSSGTNFQWDMTSGEWVTEVMQCQAWANAEANDKFTAFRFDPMEQNVDTGAKVATGDTMDIKYAAFFKTEEDAKGFNLEEYKKKLVWQEEQKAKEEAAAGKTDWPAPTFKEMETTELDKNAGTLKYTPSEDGKTVTISYEVAGETLTYTVPNNQNYLFGGYGGTDDLDRSLYSSEEVGSYDANKKYIGLFYFLWHGEHGDNGVFDLQKIIDELGIDGADNTDCGKYGPVGAMHWFAEPLYGYYYANDTWVMRKHAELLTNANIDFLYFDVTNGYAYLHNATKLMEILHQLNEEGYDAPQVVFYTNSNAHGVVQQCYDTIYSKGLYEDTWFCPNGKPVIVAPYDANINDFFQIKQNQWPNDPNFKTDGWPWMDFDWPQRVFPTSDGDGASISVSIAQHSGTVCFSHSSLYNNATNRGRSFVNSENVPSSDRKFNRALRTAYKAWQQDPTLTMQGLNFQAQFDYAIASEAKYILVTGWNEWVAQRQPGDGGQIIFIDTSSMEFSRDTEMMRGGYFDNYYMQLIYNVQKAKGTAPIVVQDNRKPINVTGEFDQWNDVIVTYQDPTGDTVNRDATGFGRQNYKNETGRNDIVSSKVVSDSKNLYFYTGTLKDITMFDTNSSWMQLYVDVDANAETGWYGYDFIINHKAKDAFTTTVAKYNGTDGAYGFETVGEVSYRVSGNQMMIAVPLEMLGIENYRAIEIQFKWADSTTTYDEMEDFYIDGDVAPLGRLNYIYQNYIEGKSIVEDETETETETDAPTEPETDPITDTPTEPETDAPTDPVTEPAGTEPADDTDDGCASVVASATLVALLTVCGTALVVRKRD